MLFHQLPTFVSSIKRLIPPFTVFERYSFWILLKWTKCIRLESLLFRLYILSFSVLNSPSKPGWYFYITSSRHTDVTV